MSILDSFKAEIATIKQEVRIAVETALLRESVRVGLSRLKTLDPKRQDAYSAALRYIGEGD